MTEWLNDEQLAVLEQKIFPSRRDAAAVCAQAHEANRLRAGLEELAGWYERRGLQESRNCCVSAGIRKLLEGGK